MIKMTETKEKQFISNLINQWKDDTISIYPVDLFNNIFKETNFHLNSKNDTLSYLNKTISIRSFYGNNDEKGYAWGFIFQYINYLLTGNEVLPMACSFQTSMYFAFEVDDKAQKAIKSILNYLQNKND